MGLRPLAVLVEDTAAVSSASDPSRKGSRSAGGIGLEPPLRRALGRPPSTERTMPDKGDDNARFSVASASAEGFYRGGLKMSDAPLLPKVELDGLRKRSNSEKTRWTFKADYRLHQLQSASQRLMPNKPMQLSNKIMNMAQ